MTICYSNNLCLCSTTVGTCVSSDTGILTSGSSRNNAFIPKMICILDITAFTGLLMLIFIYFFPRTVMMIGCRRNYFCFCFTAIGTSIGLNTRRGMGCFCCYLAIIPLVCTGFGLTTNRTDTSMKFCIVVIRFPFAPCMIGGYGNYFCLGFATDGTCVSFDT